jgi:Domain of unknown function (DUF4112)
MVLYMCQQVEGDLPFSVMSKMYSNIILDFVVGLLPLFGDLVDAAFHANIRNATELKRHLEQKGAVAMKAQRLPTPAIDPNYPSGNEGHATEDNGPLPPTRLTRLTLPRILIEDSDRPEYREWLIL